MSQWLADVVGSGFAQVSQVDDILYDHRSAYQRVQVAISPVFGRMLILDDAVQTTEVDEYLYHEMLVHPAMITHPHPQRVLIVGGGDGGTLEEALKHPIEHVTMVEIDREVVEVSQRYLPAISAGAFDDPRVRLLIDDGIAFVRMTSDRFDVVLVDSTDPKGPGTALFAAEFFTACARVLAEDGLLVAQSGSLLYQSDLSAQVRRHLGSLFPTVTTYWAPVPAYPGVLWSFVCGSKRYDPRQVDAEAAAARLTTLRTRYYSPATHSTAYRLPALP